MLLTILLSLDLCLFQSENTNVPQYCDDKARLSLHDPSEIKSITMVVINFVNPGFLLQALCAFSTFPLNRMLLSYAARPQLASTPAVSSIRASQHFCYHWCLFNLSRDSTVAQLWLSHNWTRLSRLHSDHRFLNVNCRQTLLLAS